MKNLLKPLLAVGIMGMLFSCKQSDNTNESSDMAAETTTPSGPSVPFDVVTIYHTVKDYSVWRPFYDADSSYRKANGLADIAVERAVDKPENVKIVMLISDKDKANAFSTDPRLKETMDKAGVISKPEIQYWKVVRFNPENMKDNDVRLEVVHKVKDFETWLKVYDAEGPEIRAANGLLDLAVASGTDDPNMVHIAFVVSDMEKAKARLADPALKQIMTDAGVEGMPVITFYNDASI